MAGKRANHVGARGLFTPAAGTPALIKGDRLDNETRRAKSALERVVRHESALHGMQPRAEPLDRRHRTPAHLRDGHEARVDELAVDEHGARATLALAAPLLGPGQREVLAQKVEQRLQLGTAIAACAAGVLRADYLAAGSR